MFKDLVKKQGVGTWISLSVVLLSFIALIIYGAATKSGMGLIIANGSQPFYQADRNEDAKMLSIVAPCGILALLALVAAVVLSQFKFEGVASKVVSLVIDALRIVSPVLLALVTVYFLYGSFTGLGWTFFSNEELVIFDAAKAVGRSVITGIILFGVSLVASVVAVFFDTKKKEA